VAAWSKESSLQKLAQAGLKPATLDLAAAAAYLGMSVKAFQREVAANRLPPPINISSRRKLWSIRALDRFLDGVHQPNSRDDADDPIMAAINNAAFK
jgi:predicted DNA-binding transcriptional regulator AlpA